MEKIIQALLKKHSSGSCRDRTATRGDRAPPAEWEKLPSRWKTQSGEWRWA